MVLQVNMGSSSHREVRHCMARRRTTGASMSSCSLAAAAGKPQPLSLGRPDHVVTATVHCDCPPKTVRNLLDHTQVPFAKKSNATHHKRKATKSPERWPFKQSLEPRFFYPFDFTFVCPTEIMAFNSVVEDLRGKGAEAPLPGLAPVLPVLRVWCQRVVL